MRGDRPRRRPPEGVNVDADRFDELAVSLNAGRRAAVRGLPAGAVAALVGRATDEPAAGPSGCGDEGATGKKFTDCCSRKC
jgi:hypothetical protein